MGDLVANDHEHRDGQTVGGAMHHVHRDGQVVGAVHHTHAEDDETVEEEPESQESVPFLQSIFGKSGSA